MIDLFQLWEKFIGRANTHQAGAVKPNREFVNWSNDISTALFELKFTDWEKSQKTIDDLSRPFLTSANLPVQPSLGNNYGFVVFPDDYAHFSSVRFLSKEGKGMPEPGVKLCDCKGQEYKDEGCPNFISADVWEILQSERDAKKVAEGKSTGDLYDEYTITKVPNARWGGVLRHRTKKPTLTDPKATDTDNGLKVAPQGMGVVVLDYLRKPKKATFEYTITPGNEETGEGDELVYDAVKSIPLEWSELVINEFLDMLIKNYGQFYREQFMYQTADNDRKDNP